MSINIYVGNLPYRMSDQDLSDLFGEFGGVDSAKIIIDRETGRSRGFGFVEMTSNEEGQNAIQELDGAEYEGRALKVNEAKPRENRGGGGNFRGGGGGGRRY